MATLITLAAHLALLPAQAAVMVHPAVRAAVINMASANHLVDQPLTAALAHLVALA
jgi:hypothetical protein